MSRARATSVAAVAAVLLGVLLGFVPVPYSVLGPGPVCNTLGPPRSACPAMGDAASLIEVPAADDFASASQLGFTTVSEQNREPSAATAVWAWLSSSHAVVPRELLHPPSVPESVTRRQDVQAMRDAQDASIVVAETALGKVRAQVDTVVDGSPADGVLRPADLVLAVDGRTVRDASAVVHAIAAGTAATPYALKISRGGVVSTVTLRKGMVDGRLALGVGLTNAPEIPVTLRLDPDKIGGPSAGLMFALGVYDRLTPGDLAGRTVVAGTGEIDPVTSAVGAIGGIQQKLYAARHSFHATVFLAPRDNCGDTRGAVPSGLRVVPVSSFTDALAALAAVRAGTVGSLPSC